MGDDKSWLSDIEKPQVPLSCLRQIYFCFAIETQFATGAQRMQDNGQEGEREKDGSTLIVRLNLQIVNPKKPVLE